MSASNTKLDVFGPQRVFAKVETVVVHVPVILGALKWACGFQKPTAKNHGPLRLCKSRSALTARAAMRSSKYASSGTSRISRLGVLARSRGRFTGYAKATFAWSVPRKQVAATSVSFICRRARLDGCWP